MAAGMAAAQGAVGSLLGRLSALLAGEAALLAGVRGDVQFIRDEMESMNSLLLHLTEAQHRAHHVRTWMKQVVGLARDCEAQVELYVQSVPGGEGEGLLRRPRRLAWLLWTVPARHRVARRIRELKARSRDVADRRLRYGVTVPSDEANAAAVEDGLTIDAHYSTGDEEGDAGRRRALLAAAGEPPVDDDEDTVVARGVGSLVEWLLSPEEAPQVRVFLIEQRHGWEDEELVWVEDPERIRHFRHIYDREERLAARIARGAYDHTSVASLFGFKARVEESGSKARSRVLQEILKQVDGEEASASASASVSVPQREQDKAEQLAKKLQEHFRAAGKRFLILLEDFWSGRYRSDIKAAGDGCPAGGAVIMTVPCLSMDDQPSPPPGKTFHAQSLFGFFYDKAQALVAKSRYCDVYHVAPVLEECYPDAFAMRLLLHLLYVNPNRTKDKLSSLRKSLSECKQLNRSIAEQMLMFCYNELPSKYRSCLLYLSIFHRDHIIRRTSLARRWIAEGLIATNTDRSNHWLGATDEAERYFHVLFSRGFLCPEEINVEGDIKSCTVHHQVHEFIARINRDVSFVDTNLPTELAPHLSIHNRIGLQSSHQNLPLDVNGSGIVGFLPFLAKSSQWSLLKVLDLEGCKGLKNHHLKIICKILLLRYLSLRNTDAVQLPKQIEQLQCLETLDIRQTKIQAFGRKAIVLPMLKHFLSGHKVSTSNDSTRSEESFFTVQISSLCIGRMKSMEVLSYVRVSNEENELDGIAGLLKLRKVGIVLHGKDAKLKDLFHQTEKLQQCLRSLSIRIHQPDVRETHDAGIVDALSSPPKFLQRLKLSGVITGFPRMVQELHQLVKITLRETYLKGDDLHILGKLGGLHCLRLRHKSYTESDLTFSEEEFRGLKFLAVEGSDIAKIIFVTGATPKLERIVWSSPTMAHLSGVHNLRGLKEFVLNGDCNIDQVRRAVEMNLQCAVFKHNPQV